MEITINNEELTLIVSRYVNPQNICLRLVTRDTIPCAHVSRNPATLLPEGHVAIKNWSENEGLMEALIEAGVLELTEFEVPIGLRFAPICKFPAQENG
jgi:hypothetical protein